MSCSDMRSCEIFFELISNSCDEVNIKYVKNIR